MASKRLKKKKEKHQELMQDELIVNFVEIVSDQRPEESAAEETEEIRLSGDLAGKESEEMKMNFYVQYREKEYNEQDIVNAIRQAWANEGNKVEDMKTLDIYLKVEEAKAYYVINGSINKELDL